MTPMVSVTRRESIQALTMFLLVALCACRDPTPDETCQALLRSTKYPRTVYVLQNTSMNCRELMGTYSGSIRRCYRTCGLGEYPEPDAFESCTSKCRDVGVLVH